MCVRKLINRKENTGYFKVDINITLKKNNKMNMNMKFVIYALTFLTYAYSGVGSNLIGTLRDAIVAAEAVFGDVFKNLIHVAKKFKTVHEVFDAAVDETCIFKCAGGKLFFSFYCNYYKLENNVYLLTYYYYRCSSCTK